MGLVVIIDSLHRLVPGVCDSFFFLFSACRMSGVFLFFSRNNRRPPEPVFIFVGVPITSDQSERPQPGRLISTHQPCQHVRRLSGSTRWLWLHRSIFHLLITFGFLLWEDSNKLVHFFSLKHPHNVLFIKSYNPCHKLGKGSPSYLFPVRASLLTPIQQGQFKTARFWQMFVFLGLLWVSVSLQVKVICFCCWLHQFQCAYWFQFLHIASVTHPSWFKVSTFKKQHYKFLLFY